MSHFEAAVLMLIAFAGMAMLALWGIKRPTMNHDAPSAVERVRQALLDEMQRQHNDASTTSPFTVSDNSGNSTPLDFTGLAEAAVAAAIPESVKIV